MHLDLFEQPGQERVFQSPPKIRPCIRGRDASAIRLEAGLMARMIVTWIGLASVLALLIIPYRNGLAMAVAARQFNPANFLLGEPERAAHAEILSLIQRRGAEGQP